MSNYVPSEESYAKVLSGEIKDPLDDITEEDLARIVVEGICPRDGRSMGRRDNPRVPGLNEELFCGCGFAVTT